MAFDRLIEKIVKLQNPTAVGLDTRLNYLPGFLREKAYSRYGKNLEGASSAVLEFNQGIIDAVCGTVPAVKIQCACYEMYGWQGIRTMRDTIDYAKGKGMFVIVDGKRNDIGSTMQAYASAYFGTAEVEENHFPVFDADALTVNAYLGSDGIFPLVDACRGKDKGFFVLVKTSNPSSYEIQNQSLEGGETIYELMGRFCEKWGKSLPGKYGYSGVGAVIGGTWPEQLALMRRMLPHTFFLVPGYGAQGADASDVAPAFGKGGLGAVVNASRSILCAWQKNGARPEDYAKAAAEEANRMRGDIINQVGEIRL